MVLHFGRSVGAGAVTVSASSVLEAVAGESVSVSSASVSVSAGGVLDVSGGEAVSVVSEAVSVEAAGAGILPSAQEECSRVARDGLGAPQAQRH